MTAASSVYETAPQGDVTDQPDFLNACLRIQTELAPEDLLDDFAADEVWVRAAKPEPPIPLPVEEVSVEVWRQRGAGED